MIYGVADKVFIVCTIVLFITAIIGGMFAVNAASIWIKNRREERASREREHEARVFAFAENERERWIQLLHEREQEIRKLTDEVDRLSTMNDVAGKLLTESERLRGIGDMEAKACEE